MGVIHVPVKRYDLPFWQQLSISLQTKEEVTTVLFYFLSLSTKKLLLKQYLTCLRPGTN